MEHTCSFKPSFSKAWCFISMLNFHNFIPKISRCTCVFSDSWRWWWWWWWWWWCNPNCPPHPKPPRTTVNNNDVHKIDELNWLFMFKIICEPWSLLRSLRIMGSPNSWVWEIQKNPSFLESQTRGSQLLLRNVQFSNRFNQSSDEIDTLPETNSLPMNIPILCW